MGQLVASWNRRGCRIVLYGAGEITSSLFRWTNIADAQLVAFAEPVEFVRGERIWNLDAVSPTAIGDLDANTILICANDQSGQIHRVLASLERIGFELVTLQTTQQKHFSTSPSQSKVEEFAWGTYEN